jgi:sensor histidine kinase regulating citrate/malate metabolism
MPAPDTANEEQVAVLITVRGNLIENALDAMRDKRKANQPAAALSEWLAQL